MIGSLPGDGRTTAVEHPSDPASVTTTRAPGRSLTARTTPETEAWHHPETEARITAKGPSLPHGPSDPLTPVPRSDPCILCMRPVLHPLRGPPVADVLQWLVVSDQVSVRELRNHTAEVLRRVESGQRLRVTVDRRPVAELVPLPSRAAWVARERALDAFVQADAGLRSELAEVLPDTIDQL